MDLAFLVRLSGTRVALFCGGGTSSGGWDSTPVFAPYPIIESCVLFWAQSTKCLTHEELGVKNLGSQFDVAGKPEDPPAQPHRGEALSVSASGVLQGLLEFRDVRKPFKNNIVGLSTLFKHKLHS